MVRMKHVASVFGPASALILGLSLYSLAAPESDANIKAALQQLEATRDKLATELDARNAADSAQEKPLDCCWLLPGGADGEDMWVTFRRRGGKWFAGEARVPYWRQETQVEKFSFQHREGGLSNERDKFLHAVDATALKRDGSRLTGNTVVAFKRDRTVNELVPPGGRTFMTAQGRWSLFDRWGTILHRQTRTQTYSFDVTVKTNASYLRLSIDQGINGTPVLVDGQLPTTHWVQPRIKSPWFNAGYHTAWLDGLKQEGYRLKGEVRATINPDVYWPRESIDVTYTIDASIQDGRINGTFSAQVTGLTDVHEAITGQRYGKVGSWKGPKQFNGTVSGFVYQGIEGRFSSTGEFGSCEGQVLGGVVFPSLTAKQILSSTMAQQQVAASAASTYQQIRALRLALDRYPQPLSETLAHTQMPLPVVPEEQQNAFAERLATLVASSAAPTPITGYVKPATDMTFGPYYGVQALEERDDTAQWPSDAAAGKNQRWQSISSWQTIGPFPQNRTLDGETPALPELVAVPGATYPPPAKLPSNIFTNNLSWVPAASTNSRVSVPLWAKSGKAPRPGWNNTRWYATTSIDMPVETETWIAVETMDHGALWINDLLVWVATEREFMNADRGPAIFKTTFLKGRNEIMVRCRDDRADSWFTLAFCTRGAPGASEPVSKPATQVDIPGQAGLRGFNFPSATPPLAWDTGKDINVLWRWRGTNLATVGMTFVGSGGGGSPVASDDSPGKLIVVGDQVLLNTAPHILLSLDAATGQTRWTRESSIFEYLGDEAKKAWSSATNSTAQMAVLTANAKEIGGSIASYRSLAATTPVSDGKRVFVHYPTGVTAAYDLAGKRLWMVRTRVGDASLVMASKGLILSGTPLAGWKEQYAPEAKPAAVFHSAMSLNTDSGEVLWATAARSDYKQAPFRVVVGDRELLITRRSEIVDISNGRVCAPDINLDFGTWAKWAGMCQQNDRLFMAEEPGQTTFRVMVDPQGQVGWRHDWIARRFYAFAAGGPHIATAVGNDMIVWRRPQEFAKHNPQYSLGLDFYNVADGIHKRRISRILTNTNVPLPPVQGGDYLFLPDLRGGPFTTFSNRPEEERMIAVVKLTPYPVVIAKNPTPGLSATPVPAGSRLLVRCGDEIVAIAVKGEDGRRYQEQTVMKTALADAVPPPAGSAMPNVLTAPSGRPRSDLPVMPVSGQLVDWLIAGPFPGQAPGAETPLVAKVLSDVPANGDELTVGGVKRTFAPVPAEAQSALTRFVNDGQLDDWQLRSLDRAILVEKLALTKPDDIYVFSAVVDNARDRIVSATAEPPGIETFLDGSLAAPGAPFVLKQGMHHAVLRVRPGHYRNPVFAVSVHVPQALASNAVQDIHWPTEWTVFGPAAESMSPPSSEDMKQVPGSLSLDGSPMPRKVLKAVNGKVDLAQVVQITEDSKIDQSNVAYVFAQVECPDDGYLMVNAAADWFMAWSVDGEPVYNTLLTGNRGDSATVTGHTFVRQLKKGRHTLMVKVKPGSKGWSFVSAGAFTAGDPVEVARRFPVQGLMPADKVIRVTPGLAVMEDPASVAATWREQVRMRKAIIEDAAKSQYPDIAKQAQAVLKQAGM